MAILPPAQMSPQLLNKEKTAEEAGAGLSDTEVSVFDNPAYFLFHDLKANPESSIINKYQEEMRK